MHYLLVTYALWLLVALALGLVVGWLTCSRERTRWFTGWLPPALLAVVVGLLLTGLRIVNGVPALWLETALLMFAFYLAGCCLGCLLRQILGLDAGATPRWVNEGWDNAVTAMPSAVAVAPAAPVASARPVGLAAPRGGKADDLKLIRGIGRQNEGRLHGLGIWHFDQIAAWSPETVEWVGSYLAFPGRIEREGWVAQAADLARGVDTEFARRVKRGEVATSQDDGSLGEGNVATSADLARARRED
jgi:predicted flap endonuclease-1-like 5' DNA nuclease